MTTDSADLRTPRSWLLLAAFIVVVVGVGGLIGTQSIPGAWYQGLQKPPFNPPNWVFGPVWFTLYVMIGIAGWRIWMRDRAGMSMKLWIGQMLLNWAWSPVWFIAQMLWPAFAIILVLLVLILAFVATTWRGDRWAALLFVPYAAWVGFASLLNLSIALLN
ncbi:MAG TPA: TspO/MBR family protein [Devosia sp.]|jgi:tryptophan-rich sensory protein